MECSDFICELCSSEDGRGDSIFWCHECEQKTCSTCKDQHELRYHSIIALSDYRKLPPEVLATSSYCAAHEEYYELYCKKHMQVCCSKCYIEGHTTCTEICALYDIITELTTTFPIEQMREMVEKVSGTINKARNHCLSHLQSLEEQGQQRQDDKSFTETEKNEIMMKLKSCKESERFEYATFLDTLEKLEKDCQNETKNLEIISQFASDFQVFMANDNLLKDFSKKQKDFCLIIEKETSRLCSFSEEKEILKSFQTTSFEFDFDFKGFGLRETLELLEYHSTKSNHQDVKLSINIVFDTGIDFITGCIVTKTNKYVFASTELVKVFNKNGHFEFELETKAHDIAQGYEDNIIVTSSGFNCETVVTFIDLVERKIIKTIKGIPYALGVYGIIPYRNRFLCSTEYNGIKMADVDFESHINIVQDARMDQNYIALSGNLIYHSSSDTHSVGCYNFLGDRIWAFKDQKVLSYPNGIDTDTFGNIFVVGDDHCLLIISPDGKQYRKLLSTKDGLDEPRALYIDKLQKRILIANTNNKAFLFDMK